MYLWDVARLALRRGQDHDRDLFAFGHGGQVRRGVRRRLIRRDHGADAALARATAEPEDRGPDPVAVDLVEDRSLPGAEREAEDLCREGHDRMGAHATAPATNGTIGHSPRITRDTPRRASYSASDRAWSARQRICAAWRSARERPPIGPRQPSR